MTQHVFYARWDSSERTKRCSDPLAIVQSFCLSDRFIGIRHEKRAYLFIERTDAIEKCGRDFNGSDFGRFKFAAKFHGGQLSELSERHGAAGWVLEHSGNSVALAVVVRCVAERLITRQ